MAPRTPRFQGRMGLTEPGWALRKKRGRGGRLLHINGLHAILGLTGLTGRLLQGSAYARAHEVGQRQKDTFSRVCWKIEPVRPVRPKSTFNPLKRLDRLKAMRPDFQAQADAVKPIGPNATSSQINMRGSHEREPQDVGI